MLGLGKGHCDGQACILEVSTEASLSAAAGTACAAALIAVNVHHSTAGVTEEDYQRSNTCEP